MTITISVIIILILIGFFSGTMSGLVGIGGGLVIVPCLVYFLAFSQKNAQGTSLALLTLPVVLLGMLQYYKQGYIDFRLVIFLAIGFIAGNYFGGKLAMTISDNTLKKVFSILLFLVAIKMFFEKENKSEKTKKQVKTTKIINSSN